jgi:hypothetical protein
MGPVYQNNPARKATKLKVSQGSFRVVMGLEILELFFFRVVMSFLLFEVLLLGLI